MPIVVKTYTILVQGLVQGIGFRPFIYNQANKLNLTGYVQNTKMGVIIKAQGRNVKKLLNRLQKNHIPLAKITNIKISLSKQKQFKSFIIRKSNTNKKKINEVQIMPDLCVCTECIKDIESINNRRYYYPFTNCTQCGPRYSIIKELPYDRKRTTMAKFKMCPECYQEYIDPSNRRFHAQPNACPKCGPQLYLINIKNGKIETSRDNKALIHKTQDLLKIGKIVAIKSIGGFQIAVDAKNNKAVKKLRKSKQRPVKPFAIMCKNTTIIKNLCFLNKNELKLLKSKIAPIILLKKRPLADKIISPHIAPNNAYLGVMLPYTPLHRLLFKHVSRETSKKCSKLHDKQLDVLIMTSANLKGAPILSNRHEVINKLNKIVDYVLDNNRDINSKCDDSVVFNNKSPIIIRYSRGYVPRTLLLNGIHLKPVLAFGSDLKNCFVLGSGNKVFLSPYIGDLAIGECVEFCLDMIKKYINWFGIRPEIVACDLHPDYISSRLAVEYASRHSLELVKVQHHYAHIVSVLAEHGINQPVIGLGFDGTGYGDDKAIWGSEIMVVDFNGYKRMGHLQYLPFVGGDSIITNPKLIANFYLRTIKNYNMNQYQILTSSLARLFDAIASILGICHKQTFEGQAPISLEATAMQGKPIDRKVLQKVLDKRSFRKSNCQDLLINPSEIINDIVKLKHAYIPVSDIALYFHNRIVDEFVARVNFIANQFRINKVCASGGVFQNRILLTKFRKKLINNGFIFFTNNQVPVNDSGIGLGQAVIAGLIK
ncbi:MAG: carbamoyltransferase HypF [candidate division WOR-3 bacterium]